MDPHVTARLQCRYNFDLKSGPVKIEWFLGAQTNVCYNCLDRNIEKGKGEQIAFYLEGNGTGEQSTLTYSQLLVSVCKIGNYLRSIGVEKGDNVTIYMPMIAELPAAMVRSWQNLAIRLS